MYNPLWSPSRERVERSHLHRFARTVEMSDGPGLLSYNALHSWSVRHPEAFWPRVWEFCDVKAARGWDKVLERGERLQDARWFVGAHLNFAENLLRIDDDRPAILAAGEDGRRSRLSFPELHAQVASLAAALRDLGVTPGDRVAGYLPNIPEAVVAMLATASIGAVWSTCSPDFGLDGMLDRFGQIGPKVLFTADGYLFKGQRFDSLGRVATLAGHLDGLQRVVVVPYLEPAPDLAPVDKSVRFPALLALYPSAELAFTPLPFDHPLYILYSSGTTGLPKCIVHGAGGTLIQHLKELVLHTDLHQGDRPFFYTTTGWMMWHWLVSSLAAGATVVLYDGSPFHPGPGALFQLAEELRITHFGTSAKYLGAVEKAGIKPIGQYDLGDLRTVLSTGSPLAPEGFDYVYRDVKPDLCLSSISGGTDIISCFALGNPLLPVYRGELQCVGLGMDVDVFDEKGRPLRGGKGELVCKSPFPSMPLGFWNDPQGHRYGKTYFTRFPGVWTHGDHAELTPHGGLVIHGRSDTVLNPGGVRIGTAEIYRQVEQEPDVLEGLAVGQEWKGDMRIVLFVTLRPGVTLTDELCDRLRGRIREHASPRHVPARVLQVADIPRTRNGKIMETAVRDLIHGRPVQNTSAAANPEALSYFENLAELAS